MRARWYFYFISYEFNETLQQLGDSANRENELLSDRIEYNYSRNPFLAVFYCIGIYPNGFHQDWIFRDTEFLV
ncbi:hypothetical protein DLM78_14730 [Leptospira stimsonii]|uniref:Uncharacterized protein n=1 Tax=Leptospira stimsonii TaxID=2202203 RepID=A0A8B3CP55_9LEPT|nr:hypothetical protein DLM78_14730 [Leptospira stimsonii]